MSSNKILGYIIAPISAFYFAGVLLLQLTVVPKFLKLYESFDIEQSINLPMFMICVLAYTLFTFFWSYRLIRKDSTKTDLHVGIAILAIYCIAIFGTTGWMVLNLVMPIYNLTSSF